MFLKKLENDQLDVEKMHEQLENTEEEENEELQQEELLSPGEAYKKMLWSGKIIWTNEQ